MSNADIERRTVELTMELCDVLKTSGMWLMLRDTDKQSFELRMFKLASELVEKAMR